MAQLLKITKQQRNFQKKNNKIPYIMKNLKITLAAFILLFTLQSNAQFSINLSLGSRAHYRNNDCEYYRNNNENRDCRPAVVYTGNYPYEYINSNRQIYYGNDNRNYRQVYNRGRNERRNDYAVVSNQNRYYDNNRNYYRNERNYGNERENRRENHRDRD